MGTVLKTAIFQYPDLRLSRKWHKNDHDKNRSGQFLSGFVSGQVGQESNLQPAVLEYGCFVVTGDYDLQPVITFSAPQEAPSLISKDTSTLPIFTQLSENRRHHLPLP